MESVKSRRYSLAWAGIIDYIRMATIDHAIIDLTLDFYPAAVFGKFFQRKRPKVVRIEAASRRFFEMATKVQGAGTGYEDARISCVVID